MRRHPGQNECVVVVVVAIFFLPAGHIARRATGDELVFLAFAVLILILILLFLAKFVLLIIRVYLER